MRTLLIFLIRIYQRLFSGFLGSNCRFYPTCSTYCVVALERHGLVRGLWLSVCRIGKCHPFHPGGMDYVPDL